MISTASGDIADGAPGVRGVPRRIGPANFWLDSRQQNDATELLREERLDRAIGVIYRPEAERWSPYFHARLPEQFDAIIHLDETRALERVSQLAAEWFLRHTAAAS